MSVQKIYKRNANLSMHWSKYFWKRKERPHIIPGLDKVLSEILVALIQRIDSNGNSEESLRQSKKQRLYLRDETKFRGFLSMKKSKGLFIIHHHNIRGK